MYPSPTQNAILSLTRSFQTCRPSSVFFRAAVRLKAHGKTLFAKYEDLIVVEEPAKKKPEVMPEEKPAERPSSTPAKEPQQLDPRLESDEAYEQFNQDLANHQQVWI